MSKPDPELIHTFAAHAMAAILSVVVVKTSKKYLIPDPKQVAEMAYMQAEKMFEEACASYEANKAQWDEYEKGE